MKIEILATLLAKRKNSSQLEQSTKIIQVCIHSPSSIKAVILCTALLYLCLILPGALFYGAYLKRSSELEELQNS